MWRSSDRKRNPVTGVHKIITWTSRSCPCQAQGGDYLGPLILDILICNNVDTDNSQFCAMPPADLLHLQYVQCPVCGDDQWPWLVAGSGRGVSATSGSVLHYAVVMDAGSSGTRAYLYSWPQHSGDPHQLLKWDSLLSPVN